MTEIYKKIAETLKIGKSTLYQWKKTRPELHDFLINNFHNTENKKNKNIKELEKYFKKLEKEEQEMYIAEIKARVLRKEIDKKD